jgi:transcriptional regulator with XRE-family HTH domain
MVHERELFVSSKSSVPRIGEKSYGRVMELKDKLQMLMARHALNGQKLARSSHVSDSEISRILQGKSRPGLDNAFRLARSVGVTLDYLADDSLDVEPPRPEDHLSADERRVLSLAQKIGCSQVITILENIRFLGYEVAMSRLVGGKPIIEVDKEMGDIRPAMTATAVAASGVSPRVNSVTA